VSPGSWVSGATVLVTGGHGFMGSWLARGLLDGGARVLVLGRKGSSPSGFALPGLADRCETVGAGLLDADSLQRVLVDEGVGAVFHLAAVTVVSEAARSPREAYEVNVRGTWALLDACRAAGEQVERVVVASTDRVYGAGEGLPYREGHGLKPRHPYDASKACADIVARSYALSFDMPVAVLRLANVFGGGDPHESRLVPGTVEALLLGRPPEIRSNGEMMRDFLYVEDAVAAYLAVAGSLDQAELRGRAWNAGLGKPVTVLEVVRRLIEISGVEVEPDVRGVGFPPGEVPYQWLDCSALTHELGWHPEWDLERGLEATYRWYAEQPDARLEGPGS
jgi:CDP-glucose 4,6-dehydratase